MANEYLSQDEVEELLRGVNSATEPAAAAAAAATADAVRPCNLATQERIVRGRMPTLELINENFARHLRAALFNFMRRSPELTIGQVRVVKYSEFLQDLAVPTSLNVVQLKPLRGNALFVIEPKLVSSVVDSMFGGDGRCSARVEGRDFTPTEQGIVNRLLEVLLDEYRKAWAPVYLLQPEYLRSEMHTRFATIATPTELVVETAFTLDFGTVSGKIHICFPYACVEPVRDLLFSSTQADHGEPDGRWLKMLTREVQDADVELVCRLAKADIQVRDLVSLLPGDVVPIDIPESVVASIDGVPMFDCKFGTLNGQYALRVERVLAQPRDDFSQGDNNVH